MQMSGFSLTAGFSGAYPEVMSQRFFRISFPVPRSRFCFRRGAELLAALLASLPVGARGASAANSAVEVQCDGPGVIVRAVGDSFDILASGQEEDFETDVQICQWCQDGFCRCRGRMERIYRAGRLPQRRNRIDVLQVVSDNEHEPSGSTQIDRWTVSFLGRVLASHFRNSGHYFKRNANDSQSYTLARCRRFFWYGIGILRGMALPEI